MRILMVCLGNICRSPLAEGILREKTKHLDLTIDSAGTAGYHIGKSPDPRAVAVAKKHDINISKLKARQFSRIDFENFDTIYVMDINNLSHLISLSSNAQERNKIRLILNEIDPKNHDSVPDPYYDDNGFKKVYNMLNEACEKIAIKIE
ncbi:MAG: low molecular weight phosphotyrosine protein phosphatase [Flavobacteriales bacterium]|nr:low molecular weight phosphotyrosine protein phosphatase [Flavobacteriales bacterium]MDG1934739.1 low molecular weight phosphotyrosine protein phosphatase [Flavobacteriales bacterium]MDG2086202.1 low molecular weight phosphotyrosine protein phosphatase [Flavobacteriales bacterium]